MQKQVCCPRCNEKMNKKKANPHECASCGTHFNVVIRTVPIRMKPKDEAVMERVRSAFHAIGQWYMDGFWKRIERVCIVEKHKGVCSGCTKEKDLQYAEEDPTARGVWEPYCSACMSSSLFGNEARQELVAGAKKVYTDVPRATHFYTAYDRAVGMAKSWFQENWKLLADASRKKSWLEEQKAYARTLPIMCEEDPEISHIRNSWTEIRSPLCLLKFFESYVRGSRIAQQHRRKRIERLKHLNAAYEPTEEDILKEIRGSASKTRKGKRPRRAGKLPNVAYQLIRPVCGETECPHLERYEWGWECKLHNPRLHPRPTRFPQFPETVVILKSKSYRVFPEYVEMAIWEKGTNDFAEVFGTEWFAKYGYTDFENSVYPYVWYRKGARGPEYYLMYPYTATVEVEPGAWMHVAICGPAKTLVVSVNHGRERVQSFSHGEILSMKEYYQAQRAHASRGYFHRPRANEAHKVRLVMHNETAAVANALLSMPGTLTLVHLEKHPYDREDTERTRWNRLLGYWPESLFRQLLGYKAELAGLTVRTEKISLADVARCPYCGGEFGKSWQDFVVIDRKRNLTCSCSRDFNILLAMAKIVADEVMTVV